MPRGQINGRNKNGVKTGPTGEEMARGIDECFQNYKRDTNAYPYALAYMNIHEQAKFADYVTRSNVNEKWLMKQTHDDTDTRFMELVKSNILNLNSTSIGNLAYMALNCTSPKTANRNRHLLNLWVKHTRAEFCALMFSRAMVAVGAMTFIAGCAWRIYTML